MVLYDAHEELDVVLTHCTMQLETVLLTVQLELDSESDDVVVEDGTLSVGELAGEPAGELSVLDPSDTGDDVQLPMEIPKILIHGR